MGALFFYSMRFFALQESLSKKLKYFFVYVFSFLAPFFLWQFFVYLRFHYSYYDWFLFNRGAGNKVYKNEIIKLVVKSLGASFLFGWIFAIYGTIKLYLAKEITGKTKIIIAFLIPSSISFLLWFAASSRLFYIIGVLLSLFAGYGIISLVGNKYLQTGFVSAVLFVNYFWLIFDDKFRAVMNYFFNVHY